ncbi:MAG: alpha/beta hydrolase [Cyanobacteria bacterium J06648_10]
MTVANITGIAHAYTLSEALTALDSDRSLDQETLVCVHGWLLSQTYWQPLVQQLSFRYRCLTYDLSGFGDSSPVGSPSRPHEITLPAYSTLPIDELTPQGTYRPPSYSLAAYAQRLEALLDHLDIRRTWLLGHSLGGSIALWAAYLFPERIKGVVCINAGGGIYIHSEFEKFRSAGAQMVKFRPHWLMQLPLLPYLFSHLMVRRPLAPEWGKQRVADFVRADRGAAEGALLQTTTESEVHLLPQVVGQLTQPVHFITATNDTVMPPRYVHYLASFHPGFSVGEMVTEIEDCGHMAMLEQTEAVADVVRNVVG